MVAKQVESELPFLTLSEGGECYESVAPNRENGSYIELASSLLSEERI